MAFPAYNTSLFDQSTNNIDELYTLLKQHFDNALVYINAGGAPWDSQTFVKDTNDNITEWIVTLGGISIKTTIVYNANQDVTERKLFIKGVSQAPLAYEFVMGESYAYDGNGDISTITKLTS